MTREIYEKNSDRDNEKEIARYIVSKFGGKMQQNNRLAHVDYVHTSERGRVTNVEMKRRLIIWGKYPSIFISARKLAEAMHGVRDGTRFLFVVKADDVTMYIDFKPDVIRKLKNSWAGRTDRGSSQDTEWIVSIPIGLFKKL